MTSAETPAACGDDIEVPAIAMKRSPGGPLGIAPGHGCGLLPARISIPGAVTSGLIQSPNGPREEKVVMMSGVCSVAAPVVNVAVTPVCPATKSLIAVPGCTSPSQVPSST